MIETYRVDIEDEGHEIIGEPFRAVGATAVSRWAIVDELFPTSRVMLIKPWGGVDEIVEDSAFNRELAANGEQDDE